MSDTPETREAVERWQQGKINIFDEMARLERERDEAREAFAVATSNCVEAQQRVREMADQRDFAMGEMARLERERDEARSEIKRLRDQSYSEYEMEGGSAQNPEP